MFVRLSFLGLVAVLTLVSAPLLGQVCNVKVVTDAAPDYADLPSLIDSTTSRWPTPEEKCWALFYWNHIARRQTTPMEVHGLACTDPIRQFNDYGYTMCSTIAGINCSLWDALGLKTRYWDISMHTVSEVFYNERWHIYDNSMSALYTLCDGRTIAGVEDVGREGACAASGGRKEPGHIARYHCLHATGPNGFLTGADCARSLADEYRCFNPHGLKYRYYFYDWDRGHHYILNLRPGAVYTRHYQRLGTAPKHFVPNHGRDPEMNEHGKDRFRLRGNGVWTFTPPLTPDGLPPAAYALAGVQAVAPQGVQPQQAGQPGEVVFKIDGANVITGLALEATLHRETAADAASLAVSTTNGRTWQTVWEGQATGRLPVHVELVDEVNGAYEVLVRVRLSGHQAVADARLDELRLEATTMLNSKTQPRLLLGRNTVYVGTGEQTESIVLWPDLRGDRYKPYVVEEQNVATRGEHPGYMGVMHAAQAKQDAYVVFRLDAPRDITRISYGGRFYNRAPRSHIDLLHSFDDGRTWHTSYSLTGTDPPWDVIHYETLDAVPPGTRSVLFKYLLNSSAAGSDACSLYAVRMEAHHRPAQAGFRPLEVMFRWSEVQPDRTLVQRSHTQLVTQVPFRYTVNVGGADHPVVQALRVNVQGAVPDPKPGTGVPGYEKAETRYGYSDGRDVGGEKFTPRWVTYGKNLAEGKPYTVSIPSGNQWGAGDPQGQKLTDGIVGSPYAGGIAASYGLCWTDGQRPEITVDLGSVQPCGAFRIHLTGYPFWDAMKGEVRDKIEVLTSADGQQYTSQGFFDLQLWWKDLPVNLMWPDEEVFSAPVFALLPPHPVPARYVRFHITATRFSQVSEVQVLDFIRSEPFDLRIALPADR